MTDPYSQGLLLSSFLKERHQKVKSERLSSIHQPTGRQRVLSAVGEWLVRTGTFIQQHGQSNANRSPANYALEVK